MNDILASYMRDVRRHPVLTREEEMELATKYAETKDPAIAQKLVVSNLRFVLCIACKYNKKQNLWLDLFQEGSLGLYDAIERFDHRRGNRLITFAEWHIRNRMLGFLRETMRLGTDSGETELMDLHRIACPVEEQPAALVERSQHQALLNEKLRAFEQTLDSRKSVIFHRHILMQEASTADLGTLFGVTRERIEQIKGGILVKLKTFLSRELDEATLAC